MKHSPKGKPHVGGHADITHLDEGVLNYFKEKFNVKSMLDIGCGPGGMISLALSKDIDCYGIDGDYRVKDNNPDRIIIHDFAESYYNHNRTFDLAYSCEFLEHVEERFMPNYIQSFKTCNHIITTFAPEGTPGHHHVNCKNQEYWIDKFFSYGFIFDQEITNEVRTKSTMKRNFIRENGLYFRNNK